MVIELKVYTHVLKLYNCTVNMNCKKFVDFFVTTELYHVYVALLYTYVHVLHCTVVVCAHIVIHTHTLFVYK